MEIHKVEIFDSIAQRLKLEGFNVVARDEAKPWGGFFVIDEKQAQQFADTYFYRLKTVFWQVSLNRLVYRKVGMLLSNRNIGHLPL